MPVSQQLQPDGLKGLAAGSVVVSESMAPSLFACPQWACGQVVRPDGPSGKACPLTDAPRPFERALVSLVLGSTCCLLGLVSLPFLFFPCPILSLISFRALLCFSLRLTNLATPGEQTEERWPQRREGKARQEGRGPYVPGECPRQRPLSSTWPRPRRRAS